MTHSQDTGQRVVGVTIPVPLVDAVDRAAAAELSTRAAWIRRAVLERLRETGAITDHRTKAPAA
ncbi:ribbon-helix-helix protein, CopG family [Methylobacterium nonmethylotrophicum]|uniref:ribbon-helix-helix protein, CopG family n=1 Tax=Methylobacterium nonmethylotrophicum TaxID=1141884 RepID=UPI003CCA76E7